MQKKTKEYRVKKKYNRLQFFLLAIIIIVSVSFVSTLSRYVVNSIKNSYTRSKEFYFNADKLSDKNPSYQIANWSGVDNYVITVNLNSRDNHLLASKYDINYHISYIASDNVICQLSKTNGTIYASQNTDFFNVTLTPNTKLEKGDKVFVEITANATDPYEKTIKGRFTLVVGKEELSYEIVDVPGRPYMEVNLTNTLSYYIVSTAFLEYSVGDKITEEQYLALTEEQKANCYSAIVTLNFDPSKVLLDMTNSNYINATNRGYIEINTYQYVNQLTFKVDALSSTTVRFYKVNVNEDYTYPFGTNTSIVNVSSI